MIAASSPSAPRSLLLIGAPWAPEVVEPCKLEESNSVSLTEILEHPVFQKDLRTRWRGWRLWIMPGLCLAFGIGGFFVALFLDKEIGQAAPPGGMPFPSPGFFGLMMGGLRAMIWLWPLSMMGSWVAPALTATAISREREMKTWDFLRMTPMTATEIVLAKWLAAEWPVVLSFVVTLPLASLSLMLWPSDLVVLLLSEGWLLLNAAAYSLVGLAVSSQMSGSWGAIAVTYAIIFFGVPIATYMLYGLGIGAALLLGGAKLWSSPSPPSPATMGWILGGTWAVQGFLWVVIAVGCFFISRRGVERVGR